jgi:hypothetical protein
VTSEYLEFDMGRLFINDFKSAATSTLVWWHKPFFPAYTRGRDRKITAWHQPRQKLVRPYLKNRQGMWYMVVVPATQGTEVRVLESKATGQKHGTLFENKLKATGLGCGSRSRTLTSSMKHWIQTLLPPKKKKSAAIWV